MIINECPSCNSNEICFYLIDHLNGSTDYSCMKCGFKFNDLKLKKNN